jgi:hypothetical protein
MITEIAAVGNSRLNIYIYIYIYTIYRILSCIYVLCIYIYIYFYMHICTYLCRVCMYVCTYVRMCIIYILKSLISPINSMNSGKVTSVLRVTNFRLTKGIQQRLAHSKTSSRPRAVGVCGRSLAGIAGSSPAGGMDASRLWELCCQVLISVTGQFLFHGSPAECVCVCVCARARACVCVSFSVIRCNTNTLQLQCMCRKSSG